MTRRDLIKTGAGAAALTAAASVEATIKPPSPPPIPGTILPFRPDVLRRIAETEKARLQAATDRIPSEEEVEALAAAHLPIIRRSIRKEASTGRFDFLHQFDEELAVHTYDDSLPYFIDRETEKSRRAMGAVVKQLQSEGFDAELQHTTNGNTIYVTW